MNIFTVGSAVLILSEHLVIFAWRVFQHFRKLNNSNFTSSMVLYFKFWGKLASNLCRSASFSSFFASRDSICESNCKMYEIPFLILFILLNSIKTSQIDVSIYLYHTFSTLLTLSSSLNWASIVPISCLNLAINLNGLFQIILIFK